MDDFDDVYGSAFAPETVKPVPEDWDAVYNPSAAFGTLNPKVNPIEQIAEEKLLPGAAKAVRSLTPRAIGAAMTRDRQLEGEPEPIRDLRRQLEQREAEKVVGPPSIANQIAAGVEGAADMSTLGLHHHMGALIGKGLGKFGVSGYEKIADMPYWDVVKKSQGIQEALEKQNPGSALAGKGAGLGLGMVMNPALIPSKGKIASNIATGGAYSGVSELAHSGDPVKAVGATVLGGATGGLLGSALEKIFAKVGRQGALDANGNLSPEATRIALQAGVNPQDLQTLTPHLAAAMEKKGINVPAAREAQFSEFGIQPTRGMTTQKSKDLIRETDYAPEVRGNVDIQAKTAAAKAAGNINSTPAESMEYAVQGLKTKAVADKAAADAKYTVAGQQPGNFPPSELHDWGTTIFNNWTNKGPRTPVLHPDSTPKAWSALEYLNRELGRPMDFLGQTVPPNTTMRGMEEARKHLRQLADAPGTKQDGAAMGEVIRDFDKQVQQKISQGQFSGNPQVGQMWFDARRDWAKMSQKYGKTKGGDDSGNFVKTILDNDMPPGAVANYFYNLSTVGQAASKVSAFKSYTQLERALGKGSPELEAVKSSVMQRFMTPPNAEKARVINPFMDSRRSIEDFLDGRGRDLANRMLSKGERDTLRRFAGVMKTAENKGESGLQTRFRELAEQTARYGFHGVNGAMSIWGQTHGVPMAVMGSAAVEAGRLVHAMARPVFERHRAASGAATNLVNPKVRTGVGMAIPAAPGIAENYQDYKDDNKDQFDKKPIYTRNGLTITGRASGGRVLSSTVRDLLAEAENARIRLGHSTKKILNMPDHEVGEALELAKGI